jgi:hypothetical protein
VTGTNNDGTSAGTLGGGYTVSAVLTAAGAAVVTVTHTASGAVATFNAAVTAVVLDRITAVYTPGGIVYPSAALDTLKANLVVTAVQNNGATATLDASAYTLGGTLAAGTSTVTVAYAGKLTAFTLTVTEAALTGITVTNAKTAYNALELFDLSGALVTASYADGLTAAVDALSVGIAYQNGKTAIWGDHAYVTVSYTEGGVTKSTQVAVTAAKRTAAPAAPNALILDLNGGILTLTNALLPAGWTFAASNEQISAVGTIARAVVFTPSDALMYAGGTVNYTTAAAEVTITVIDGTVTGGADGTQTPPDDGGKTGWTWLDYAALIAGILILLIAILIIIKIIRDLRERRREADGRN